MINDGRLGGKLAKKWIGPYIVQKLTKTNALLKSCVTGDVLKNLVPKVQMKPYIDEQKINQCSPRKSNELVISEEHSYAQSKRNINHILQTDIIE